jgi:HK97 family phage major capsid protein
VFPRLTALRGEFNKLTGTIQKINDTAAAGKRDLTDAENAEVGTLLDRAEQLKPEIEKLAAQADTLSSVNAIFDRVSGTTTTLVEDRVGNRSEPAKLTAGEFLVAAFDLLGGNLTEAQFLDRTARYHDRAVQATTDTLGLMPQPIVGEILKLNDARRPVFASFKSCPMPGLGRKFDRPRISQRAAVGEQAAEHDAVTSQKMTVTFDEITKRTIAGSLEMSNQDIEWSDPAALDLLVADFMDLYVEFSEGLACTKLMGTSATTSPYVATNVTTLVDSYVDGVIAAYNLAKRNPDTVWLDLASWAVLATTMTASENRSALVVLRETLTELGTPMRFVVGPQLSANSRVIGTSTLIESYEKQNGLLRATKVSTLAQEIGYSGYVAFHALAQFGVELVAA